MHVGRSYRPIEFALWSRGSILFMVLVSLCAIGAYSIPSIAGFSVPWPIIVVLGTTVSLMAGFKNSQVLARSSEALQAFAQISATSRMLSRFCCDFTDEPTKRALVYRHIAWMTALRFCLRRPMPWESMGRKSNAAFRKRYRVIEDTTSLSDELTALLGHDEAAKILKSGMLAAPLQLLNQQGHQINLLFRDAGLAPQVYTELLKLLRDLHDQQARCDRIKNSPYPRQYAIVSTMFVAIFCTLLPFGAVPVFAEMSRLGGVWGVISIWLTIPFSALLGWMYMSLDQVGESTSNPFEGGANDVPISQICRELEIELRSAMGELDLPKPLQPRNGIAT
ncbi:bestrophin family protein [Kaistia terrae]|uniref:Bestrophin family protein n=1 Tax=Kaistia terrae TaxID=537017 RepID=A0ABW0PPE6_9HYPH|nr:bestrophin family ion channel [Kaistia terrae]MCX5577728.1 bestrophin family ion channel [Kaistia terrae]